METTTGKPTTNTEPNQTVFVPNYPARVGQPSIIVKHGVNQDNIGYIYSEYDADRQEHFYHATDFNGTDVFPEKMKSLDMLKSLFVGYAEDIHHELVHGHISPPVDPILKAKRDAELEQLRSEKDGNNKQLNR